jgi:DNA primase
MGGLIPDSFVQELLERIEIVDIIERHVQLKRSGREFQACCPFHEEKTPSFTVSPQKQFYHCFGCGAHGSAIGFLMNYEGLEFVDAVEDLAKMAGLKVPREASRQARPSSGLYELLAEAARWYQQLLRANQDAIDYLKGRGLTGEVVKEFGIGYSPSEWDGLIRKLGSDDTRLKLLQRTGMLSQGKSGQYDKFRGRIMFPIHDRRGRVIGFGGRAMGDDGPKYLNSPETELFHKGRELYGLYMARKGQGRMDRIIVVEGYMDVVALAQYGIQGTVATLGTATTGDQSELLFRAADEVVFCFDGDRAGRKAAWRALESVLPRLREGRQARFLFLPDGEDPDSMVRSVGKEAFEKLVEQAQPLSGFFFDHFIAMVDMESIDGRARLVDLARPDLERLPDGVFKEMMFDRLAELAHHRFAGRETPAGRFDSKRAPKGATRHARTPMRLALAHLVQNPSLAESLEESEKFADWDLPGLEIWQKLVEFCFSRPHMSTAQLLESLREHPAHEHLETLATWPLAGDDEEQVREFQDAVTGLELQWLDKQISALPKIIELSAQDREHLLSLQRQRRELRDALRGRDEA